MPRAKRPLAEADPNASAPAAKRNMPEDTGKENSKPLVKMTVAELSSLCKERKLKVTGKKDDLIARLIMGTDYSQAAIAAMSKVGYPPGSSPGKANRTRNRLLQMLRTPPTTWNLRQSASPESARGRMKMKMTRKVSLNARMRSSTRRTVSVISRLPITPIGSGSSAKQETLVARTLPRKSTSVIRTHMISTTTTITTGMGNRRSSTMR
jgi:hypothetical protein